MKIIEEIIGASGWVSGNPKYEVIKVNAAETKTARLITREMMANFEFFIFYN